MKTVEHHPGIIKKASMRNAVGRPLYISLAIFSGYSLLLIIQAFYRIELYLVLIFWLAGLVVFSLIEYMVHRFFFHMSGSSAMVQRTRYKVHGSHHQHPIDASGMMIRPWMALVVLFLLTPVFYFLFQLNFLAFLPGFLCGYSLYLFIHFAIHFFRPPENILRKLWKQHCLHHYYDPNSNFGVSSPLWDLIFHTYLKNKPIQKNYPGELR